MIQSYPLLFYTAGGIFYSNAYCLPVRLPCGERCRSVLFFVIKFWREGENEFHLAFVTDEYDVFHAKHKEMGCICYENPANGVNNGQVQIRQSALDEADKYFR